MTMQKLMLPEFDTSDEETSEMASFLNKLVKNAEHAPWGVFTRLPVRVESTREEACTLVADFEMDRRHSAQETSDDHIKEVANLHAHNLKDSDMRELAEEVWTKFYEVIQRFGIEPTWENRALELVVDKTNTERVSLIAAKYYGPNGGSLRIGILFKLDNLKEEFLSRLKIGLPDPEEKLVVH